MENKISSRATVARRRILIVEAHPLMRRGLTALIDNEPDLTVCAAVAGHREGLAVIASSRPQLVIAGLLFDEVDGLVLVREIRSEYRDLPILLLTLHDAPRYIQRALHAGASGCVTKRDTAETLLTGIRCVLDEAKYVSPGIGVALDTT
jgi:DNA-binding NarL/FixJ family response regulator